ncbi:MAG: DUF3795 domain-containing protein [Candidatus Cloacimonetes bacterium]|nr:DUF3795 domain-containing protein [Candidatus Cloacimonadota bacterium]
MSRLHAYCGLYCGACCSMVTHEKQSGVPSAQELQTDDKEQPCMGCDTEYQQNCEFVLCNKSHGTESCAFCPEFPCEMITKFNNEEWEHHQVVLKNLYRIKEIGIETWLAEQETYWSCPACGCRTQWYQEKCTKCGEQIERRI